MISAKKEEWRYTNLKREREYEVKQDKLESDHKAFKRARKDYVPPGSTLENCTECNRNKEPNDKYHLWHLSEKELKKHKIAKKLIFGG